MLFGSVLMPNLGHPKGGPIRKIRKFKTLGRSVHWMDQSRFRERDKHRIGKTVQPINSDLVILVRSNFLDELRRPVTLAWIYLIFLPQENNLVWSMERLALKVNLLFHILYYRSRLFQKISTPTNTLCWNCQYPALSLSDSVCASPGGFMMAKQKKRSLPPCE